MSLHNRLTAVERTLNPTPQDPIEIVVRGGIYAEAWDATIDGHRLERADNETEDAFRKRAMEEAQKAKASTFVVGGLPESPMTEQEREVITRRVRIESFGGPPMAPTP